MITNQFVGAAVQAATTRGAVIVFGYDAYGTPNMGIMKGDHWDEDATAAVATLTYVCEDDVALAYKILRKVARDFGKTLNIDANSERQFIGD